MGHFAPALWASVVFSLVFLSSACGGRSSTEASVATAHNNRTGAGSLVFHINDSSNIYIPGERYDGLFTLRNGDEVLSLTRVDSLCFEVPIFNGLLCLGPEGSGVWTDVLRTGTTPYQVSCSWVPNGDSEAANTRPMEPLETSTWRLKFGREDPWYGDLVMRVGTNGKAEGTIETATGDFRYLHGDVTDQHWTLQTFDGAHLFKFTGNFDGDSITNGWFASGHHYGTPMSGERHSSHNAPLSNGKEAVWTGLPVSFSGKNLMAGETNWNWADHRDSVHILSVMGSWCPNCLDEHRLLRNLIQEFQNVQIHTLAFERGLEQSNGEKRALRRLKQYAEEMQLWRYEDRWDITLIGPASKSEARNLLPFLDQVVSFPTTIVLHPDLDTPWIHSGFNGPATGVKYELERSALTSALSGHSENR